MDLPQDPCTPEQKNCFSKSAMNATRSMRRSGAFGPMPKPVFRAGFVTFARVGSESRAGRRSLTVLPFAERGTASAGSADDLALSRTCPPATGSSRLRDLCQFKEDAGSLYSTPPNERNLQRNQVKP